MEQLALAIVAALLVIAAISDMRRYMIPNWLTLGIALAFAASRFVSPFNLLDLSQRIAAAALLLLVGFILFARNLFGGGDVKLIAALALWLGLAALPRFLLLMSLAGGVLALTLLLVRWMRSRSSEKLDHRIPYGVAIAAAGLDFCLQQQHVYEKIANLIGH